MNKKIISFFAAAALAFSAVTPVLAKKTEITDTEFAFPGDASLEEMFSGVVSGSAAWSSSDSIENYVSFSEGELTVEPKVTKSALLALDKSITAQKFELSADLRISTDAERKNYFTGISFGADESGYYQLLFAADGMVRLAKTDKLLTAATGTVLSEEDISTLVKYDGSAAAGIKLLVEKGKAQFFAGDNLLLTYTNESFAPNGYFGFLTTRDMKAVYKNFKIKYSKFTEVYEEIDYKISDFEVAEKNQNALISWKNPMVPEISKITLSDGEENEINDYTGTISLAEGAANEIIISGLERNKEHSFKLKTDFKNHESTQSDIKSIIIPYSEEDYKVTDFSLKPIIKGAEISWKNPSVNSISKITVEDSEGNTYPCSASLEAGAENTLTVRNLLPGTEYEFIVTVEFSSHVASTAKGKVSVPEANEAKYQPKNVLVYEKNGRLGLSWKNPACEISSIRVLNYETGEDCETDGTILKEASANNCILVNGLSNVEASVIKLIFEFSDGHDCVEILCDGTADKTESTYEQKMQNYINDWTLFYNVNTASVPQMPGKMILDHEEKFSGNSSVKIVGNHQKEYNNVYYQLRQTLSGYDATKTYIVSMKVKYINAKNSVLLAYDNAPMNSYSDGRAQSQLNVGSNLTVAESSNGWDTLEFIMLSSKPNGTARAEGKNLAVQLYAGAEGFWIDDLSMCPIDADGNVTGESIIKNGGFEIEDNTPCSIVKLEKDKCSLKNGTAHLEWQNPEDTQFDGVVIYTEIDGALYERARLSKKHSSINLENVSGSDKVKFVIKTIDIVNNYSDGAEIELNHEVTDCVISDIVFRYNGEVITSVPENVSGTVTASISVKNNKLEAFKGSLWVAVYKDGVLVGVVSSQEMSFEKGGGEVSLSAAFDIPQKEGCSAEVFFVDNISNMKLLAKNAILK